MSSKDQRRALFRMKLKEREKRIDDPLVSLCSVVSFLPGCNVFCGEVESLEEMATDCIFNMFRYNDDNQPICKVCNVALKSEANWPAHQVSSKHAEAIKKLKAAAAAAASEKNHVNEGVPLPEVIPKTRAASSLPANFFDNPDMKKQKKGPDVESKVSPTSLQASVKPKDSHQTQSVRTDETPAVGQTSDLSNRINKTYVVEAKEGNESGPSSTLNQSSRNTITSESKQVKGALPEGFFDNKDADLRARGIELVKVDIKDEYKEFEKAIQEDLQEVDERLVEDEFDAAEMQEEAESFEQKVWSLLRACRERVEMLKKKQMAFEAAKRELLNKKDVVFRGQESSEDSGDGDDDGDFAVDWRAKHL
ncbi:hypothetical protein ACLOJK_018065 [Asimina triloba]